MTTKEAEELIAKKNAAARDYLQTRLFRAQRHARRVLERTTGSRSGIDISTINEDWRAERPEKAGVNWSACGTQDIATTKAFAQALAEITQIAEDYNTERAELLEDLEASAADIRKRAKRAEEADETEYQEWGDNPADR